MKFIDEVEILVASGNGGPGCVSFLREAKMPRGGPDGGDGGRGGHVIFKVNPQLNSLLDLRYQKEYRATNGQPGSNRKKTGCDGQDVVISVPPGTLVTGGDGRLLREFSDEEEFVFLKGGLGGKGNTFYKSSVHQAPQIAQKGEPGKEVNLRLELKLLADVGLLGFPNVGKSTLISRISAAKVKVANYPFTTLTPNLGVVKLEEEKSFVVADIPGLVPDAHKGKGLGLKFLRHIERTRCFVHVIEPSMFSGRDPLEDFDAINKELKFYDELKNLEKPLMSRAQIVVLNKMDSIAAEDRQQILDQFAQRDVRVLPVSAISGENIEKLVFQMGDFVFDLKQE